MSNDKDFKVKNGIQPTVYHEGLGTVGIAGGVATLDLSTGSVFEVTPTSDVQVTLSNPADSGTVSGATLLLEGAEATGVASTFSTTIYNGTATTESHRIQNGIDLAGDGGLVWIKKRDSNIANTNHYLSDTERGNFYIASNSTNVQAAGDIASYNSDGWTFNASTGLGTDYLAAQSYVSWTFKKQAKFFDIVTWTGNGTHPRTFNHSLNCSIGFMATKETNASGNWTSFHRGLANGFGTGRVYLNATNSVQNESLEFLTSNNSSFTLTSDTGLNSNGVNYVAYLFAHDTDASSLIKCGSFTHSTSTGNDIDLGWEPQWLLYKASDGTTGWYLWDTTRGWDATTQSNLRADANSAESTGSNTAAGWPQPTSTGFRLGTNSYAGDNKTFIYMAIRAENIPTITYDSTLEWPGGTAPTAPAKGETDVVTFNTRDGGSTYQGVLAIDGAK